MLHLEPTLLANTLSGGAGPSGDGGTPGGGPSGETPFAKAAGFLEIVRCKSRRLRRGVDGNIEASKPQESSGDADAAFRARTGG